MHLGKQAKTTLRSTGRLKFLLRLWLRPPLNLKPELIGDRLRGALLLAALASILRPTNLLIWLCIGLFSFVDTSRKERIVLVREALLCGYVLELVVY